MRNEYPLYLNGAWTTQTDGCVREDIEPATGKPLFTVHRAGPADVETALSTAAAAFPGWAAAMADVRERVLLRAADVMESRAEEFLELLVREGGKAQSIARGEFAGSGSSRDQTAHCGGGSRCTGHAQEITAGNLILFHNNSSLFCLVYTPKHL